MTVKNLKCEQLLFVCLCVYKNNYIPHYPIAIESALQCTQKHYLAMHELLFLLIPNTTMHAIGLSTEDKLTSDHLQHHSNIIYIK